MLTPDQVRDVLSSTETDRVERTISTKDRDKFREAICSFSNDMPGHARPGYLLIGINDDGTLKSGFIPTDDIQQQFAAYRNDGAILPQPMMSVYKQAHPDGGEFLVVEVIPSDMPPVRYHGKVHIRVGPRKATANESEERRLIERRCASFRTFDITPCPMAAINDMDLDSFQNTYRTSAIDAEVIRENCRELVEQLAALRFFNLTQNRPTNAGVILFGEDPLNIFPGAYIQYVKFDGKTLSDPVLEQKQFTGNLMVLLRELDSFIGGKFTQKPIEDSALRERLVWDYPEKAMRELLVNAILHRDYQSNQPVRFYFFSDRIEIQNPGGLYGDARPENFPRVNDYRNPVLAEAMVVLGYANRFGRGVARAQRNLEENGSPQAQFEYEGTHFLATVFKHLLR
ncbi:MAG: ATP-binding protein [Candidatus Methylacidiphilales bacterium]|nr:ATP-binding protein [Candidatus Methylacidiphilales bacterium]